MCQMLLMVWVTHQDPSLPISVVFSSMRYSLGAEEITVLDLCKLGIFSSRWNRLVGVGLIFIVNFMRCRITQTINL